jgi:hypothetical protein
MSRIPPLAIIRQRFVGTSPAYTVGDTELNPTGCDTTAQLLDIPHSAALDNFIRQRESARQAAFPTSPAAGMIVRLSATPGDTAPGTPLEPLAVLLDRETTLGRWRGWLVGRDPTYATAWDLILGPEDDPRDPQCQVVQVWNVTTLAGNRTDRVLAQLPADRMAAVRAMERDLAAHTQPPDITDTRMGVLLARELSDGTGVVTGTPVAVAPAPTFSAAPAVAIDDPRLAYREIYRQAAEWVARQSMPIAKPVAAPVEPESWLARLFASRWQPAAAFALVAAMVSSLLWTQFTDPAIPPQPDDNRYISGAGMQQLLVAKPAETARIIEERLRGLGVAPEIRHETGGGIVIQADLSRLDPARRSQFFIDLRLPIPEDGRLALLLIKGQE